MLVSGSEPKAAQVQLLETVAWLAASMGRMLDARTDDRRKV
jgi:hypothetical protein